MDTPPESRLRKALFRFWEAALAGLYLLGLGATLLVGLVGLRYCVSQAGEREDGWVPLIISGCLFLPLILYPGYRLARLAWEVLSELRDALSGFHNHRN